MKKLAIAALLAAALSGTATVGYASDWVKDFWAQQERSSGG